MSEIKNIEKFIKPVDNFTIKYNNEFEFSVTPRLNLADTVSFVNSIVSELYDSEEELIAYELKDYAIRINTLIYYTDIQLPESLSNKYELVYGTDIVDKIIKDREFNSDVYTQLVNSIDPKIACINEKMQNQFKLGTKEYIDQVTEELKTVVDTFTNFSNTFGDIFNNMSKDELKSLVPKLSAMENFSESNVVKAILAEKKKKKPSPAPKPKKTK